MTAPGDIKGRWLLPVAVLLSAIAACSLILWGGIQLAEYAISAFSGEGPSSAALGETIASIIIFGLLLAAGLAGGAVCGFNAARAGPRAGRRLLEGGGIGVIGLLIATTLAGVAGVLDRANGGIGAGMFVWGTALTVLQAGSEEVFFRGWLQPVLVRAWGAIAGILVTAFGFAALHLVGGASSVVSVLNLFLGGLLFGLLAVRFGGIAAAVAAHIGWNWAEQLLFGLFPNPGVGSFGSVLNLDLAGSSWWGGSPEGLNASIAMTFALAILLAPLLILPARDSRQPGLYRSDRAPA